MLAGPCVDDMAALPYELRPGPAGYELVCEADHIAHPSLGWVLGWYDPAEATVYLWDDNYLPTGYVLAHEAAHHTLGHRPGQPWVEQEANAVADKVIGPIP